MPVTTKGTADRWRGRFERQSLAPVFGIGRRGRARSYHAFVPDGILDLAPRLDATARSAIAAAESELLALNRSIPDSSPLRTVGKQLLRAEAIASSAIEGLQLSHARLARASVYPQFDRKAREILNNVQAMERAIDIGRREEDLTVRDLQDIHAHLAGGTLLARYAGVLRTEPGWIDGTTPADARYVPPPHEHIAPLLDDLLAFVNERGDLSPIEQAAYAHAQFETIHPFPDGNGRVGRCLIHILLIRAGVAPHYVPPISLALAARRDAYMSGLTAFQHDDLDSWVAFFAEAVHAATREAEAFAASIATLQARWRARLADERIRSDSAAWILVDELPAHPVLDRNTACSITDRTWPASSSALARLEAAGIVKRRDNRKRGVSWEAPEILDRVRAFEASVTTPHDDDEPWDELDDEESVGD